MCAFPNENTPPSPAPIQYPPLRVVVAIPTMGETSRRAPVDPWNRASPNAKTPPSLATSRYPRPPNAGAIPTIGRLRCNPNSEPQFGALPKGHTLPAWPAIQYAMWFGGAVHALAAAGGTPAVPA